MAGVVFSFPELFLEMGDVMLFGHVFSLHNGIGFQTMNCGLFFQYE